MSVDDRMRERLEKRLKEPDLHPAFRAEFERVLKLLQPPPQSALPGERAN